MGRVVAGVDGSDGGRRALEFAIDEARRRQSALEVVYVAPPPRTGFSNSPGMSSEYVSGDAMKTRAERETSEFKDQMDHAREAAESLVGRLIASLDHDGITISETVLVDRRPARRLVELVNSDGDVDMLIVGSRGQGELTGRLLGSVSQACVSNSHVPVTVVPPGP